MCFRVYKNILTKKKNSLVINAILLRQKKIISFMILITVIENFMPIDCEKMRTVIRDCALY